MEKSKEKTKKIASKVEPKKEIKKETVKKVVATKKTATKKTAAKKVATPKTAEKKVVAKEAPKKASAKTAAKKSTVKKVAESKAVVSKVMPKVEVSKVMPKAAVSKVEQKEKQKVLFVVSECQPFCATGGLADVAGGLPKYISKNSNFDVRVMLPMYSSIPQEYRKDFKFLGNTNIPLAWRSIYCGVFSYELDGVTYYFLDNESYFKRDGIYSYYDDGERFAFTSRAVLQVLPIINYYPDILHCNDWQFALVPVYLKTHYSNNNAYNKIKTIFTCHNTEYQGKFDVKSISDLFGIDAKYTAMLEHSGSLNLVKGSVVCCDKFTTVSPTYAQEIIFDAEISNGLDSILRENKYKIVGILNGVDCEFYNPKTDKALFKNYDVKTFKLKQENKKALQKEYGFIEDENAPMISIVTRMAKHKGLDLIKASFEGLLNQHPSLQVIIVGSGTDEYEQYFKYLQNKFVGRVKVALGYSNKEARKAYAASDIFVMPSKSEPCGISQMIASRYGAIPIVRETGGLKDSIKDFGCEGGGNGYTFANYNTNDFIYSINRALKDFEDKTSWVEKIKICMNKDFSWNVSAKEYANLYADLLK